jgi:lipopolysaccharide transport system permease protein
MINLTYIPKHILFSLFKHRSLIKSLVKREVLGRYKGSMFGVLWSLINPIFMLIVYTFVFSVVFKARWSGGSDSKVEFALILFIGLIVFNFFSECFTRAPTLILQNVNFVKKVIFPLEILSFVSIGTALFHALISFSVWLIAYLIMYGPPSPTIFLLPLMLLPIIFFTLGISWIFSSLGVFLRDVSQIVGLFNTVLLFLSPIFFPVSSLPEKFQFLVNLNPIAPSIEDSRRVLYWGLLPNWPEYFLCLFLGLLVSCLGFFWFQKTRKGFADVL